ncbi:MAG: right-handed parallel beta-helix repeat-containing protein, partial [Planctomycetota bacterium]
MTEFTDAPVLDPTDNTFLVGAETNTPAVWNRYSGNKYIGCVPYGHICVTTTLGKKLYQCTEGSDNVATIEAALQHGYDNLPMADIEFGPGYFDIIGGCTLVPDTTDPTKWGLTIRGQGKSTQLRFIGPSAYATGKWFAIRIKPTVFPTTGDYDNYLHSFSITNMSVYDEAPYLHASSEETHGFNIWYCVGATLSNNNLYNIGDEGCELEYCHGSHMSGNYAWRCNIAEEGGGAALSCKNGSGEVVITNNVVTDNVPDAWTSGYTFAANERTRRSGITYKSISGGNINNDPAGAGAASWTNVSAFNGGDGPLNYGIDVKIAEAATATNVTIAGNTIARIETAAYRIAGTNAVTGNITITGGSIDEVDYALSKTGYGCTGLVFSDMTITNIRADVVNIVNSQVGASNDKDWLIHDLVVDTVARDFMNIDRTDGLKLHDCKFKTVTGGLVAQNVTNIKLLDNEFEDCGNSSQMFIRNLAVSTGMEFSGNDCINCDSTTRFVFNFNTVNDNSLDMVSPHHFSVDVVDEFRGNTTNGGVRRSV